LSRVCLSGAGPWSNVAPVCRLLSSCLCVCLFWSGSGIFATPVQAADALKLEIGTLEGDGWDLSGLRVQLDLGAPVPAVALHIETLRVAGQAQLESLRLQCAAFQLRGLGGTCPRAQVEFMHPVLGVQRITTAFTYRHPGRLELDLQDWPLAGGQVQGQLRLDGDHWQVDARAQGLDLPALAALSGIIGQPWPLQPAAGNARLALKARGRGAAPQSLELELDVAGVDFASEDGLQAGEGLGADLSLALVREDGGYGMSLDARWSAGGLYLHPVFVEAEQPVSMAFRGHYQADADTLLVQALRLSQPQVFDLSMTGRWSPGQGLQGLDGLVDVQQLSLDPAYGIYAQPFLPGTALDDIDAQGSLSGRARVEAGLPRQVALQMLGVGIQDRRGRFALQGVDGALHWQAQGEAPSSRVSIGGGHVYGIALGAARIQPQISRDGFRLPSPVHLPVLDGALEIRGLEVAGLGTGEARWAFDGGLAPISMEQLTGALGWPQLSGTLAGIIPNVRYEQGLLTVGGRLLVRAFDGNITLGDLRLRDPLGVAPELSAQIQVRGLDLAELTRTFDVGQITGRLEGDVRDLVLVRWSPVQFDAEFRTPPGDRSPRRISQRAVDNLTRVGGGMGGVLSGGFLRFFEDFSYRQLGLSCRLVGEICFMDGVAPAEQGYYIVQGSGLPQINVIGFTREVAWRDLVTRLATVVFEGGGAVVR